MKTTHTFQFNFLKITTIVLFLLGCTTQQFFGQQDTQYTQYMYNTSTINPAYAGSHESITATLLYRNQWAGIVGAPKTINFTIHSSLDEWRGIGGGLSLISDKIGAISQTSITSDFSYTVRSGEVSELAFGIKAGLDVLSIDNSLLTIYDPTDLKIIQNLRNRSSPIIGAGVYYYNEEFYVGLSVPNLLTTKIYDDNTAVSQARKRQNFYLMSGYVFELNADWFFKPAVLVKAVDGAPVAVDLSANFLYNERFTMGAGFRYNAAFSGLVGIQASETLFIGYSYDYDLTDLGTYSNGSHELFVRFSLGDRRNKRLLIPRFF
ncbi:type IX secretion system membrane protein PorP/SprF [uncultured Polaribacter sp.]|uniref:PorP/SprF family type IX secretion system membrane protein n=1 Tax=uncultured Polaribacter sp. TaxID=174711 RepID=UPI00261351AE|nr:type IX secretion system membrane protein PorP/SprF [uncultured Polaribacter sp.]